MGVGVRISFWFVIKLSEWNESFLGNFWGPPNLSSSCDNNYTHVKHVSCISVIFGRYQMMGKKNSRKIALRRDSALQKEVACRTGIRRLCEAHAFIAGLPILCQILARKAGQRAFVDWNKLVHQQGQGSARYSCEGVWVRRAHQKNTLQNIRCLILHHTSGFITQHMTVLWSFNNICCMLHWYAV